MALLWPTKQQRPERVKSASWDEASVQLIQTYGGLPHLGDYAALYRAQPAVRTVVDFLARNIGALNLKTYLRHDNDDRVEVDEHPLAVLLRNPNPTTTRYRHMNDTVADLGIYDRAYWVKDRYPNAKAVVRLPPSRLERTLNPETGVLNYFGPNGDAIPRNRLVVFSGYSPEGAWSDEDGVSPLETLRRTLAEEYASQTHRANFWKNAARQAGTIQRPLDAPDWSDDARTRFRTDWDNTMTGAAGSGRTAILEEGMLWNPASFSPKDSEYIAGRQLAFDEVSRAYGISPKLFGAGDTVQANLDTYHRQLYQDTLQPYLRMIQDEVELQLLPDLDTTPASVGRVYVEFNLADKLKFSFEEEARVLTTSTGVPITSVNESRARLNLPRIDDKAFDEPVKPMNVTYGGQPAPTIPTAVPQPGGGSPPEGLNPKPVVNEGAPALPPGKRLRSGQKKRVPPAVLRRHEDAVKAHRLLFERYFRDQRRAVESKAAAFDMKRWDATLHERLYAERTKLARRTGKLAAKQIRGTYDEKQTLAYLDETARVEAESINANTAQDLTQRSIKDVFDDALNNRAVQLAIGTATAVIGWSRTEAAKQSTQQDGRMRRKTWVVTSGSKSRHPELDGETVDMWDDQGNETTFSNGAKYPGDPSADVNEIASCQCVMDIS